MSVLVEPSDTRSEHAAKPAHTQRSASSPPLSSSSPISKMVTSMVRRVSGEPGELSLGLDEAPSTPKPGSVAAILSFLPLSKPLPAVSLQGEFFIGARLRATVCTDCYSVGDNLARERVDAVQWLAWRRHRWSADHGEVIARSRPQEVPSECSSSFGASYTISIMDVGCFLSVSLEGLPGLPPPVLTSRGMAAGKAMSSSFVQVAPEPRGWVVHDDCCWMTTDDP